MSAKATILINGKEVDAATVAKLSDDIPRGAWVLNSEGEIETDWARARELFREEASMSRAEFLKAATRAGLITETEAFSAIKGDWPDSFNSVLEAMPEAARFDAKMDWAAASNITRNADLMMTIIAAMELDPKAIDAMFGYSGQ